MRNKRLSFYSFILMIFIIGIWTTLGYSLNEKTHRAINEQVAKKVIDGFSLDSYLKSHLGFKSGIEDEFLKGSDKKLVFEWLGEGGEQEDRPGAWYDYMLGRPTRSVNHFHNPLLPWDQAGLDDSVLGISFMGQSSVLWSQRQAITQSPGGYYSWYDVRDYFYNALTLTNTTNREQNFAETFRGVGQLMHLVEDLSVPEHTRDDGHYLKAYEGWVFDTQNSSDPQRKAIFDTALANPVFFDPAAMGDPNPLASIPIANLFDTNQYDGTNPNITIQNNIGLSEYTNANFVSPDSIFTAAFSYPDWSTVTEYDEVIDISTGKKKTYLKKLCYAEGGNGEGVNHLAVGRLFYKYLPSNIKNKGLTFDDRVYSGYASLLIPRAVGYSAGLLNYFFRGKINIIQTGNDRFQIINFSDEDMEGNLSSFKLYYDDTNDERYEIPLIFLDQSGSQITDPNTILTIPELSKSIPFYFLIIRQ